MPLNDPGNDLENQLSYGKYKQTVREFHDSGWKNSSHISADVSMLGYGCGVSVYPQFYDKEKETFHMLPRPNVTNKIRQQLQGLTMSESINVEGTFVVKIPFMKQENNF